ncbi:hypothetical protein BDF14DRAFT_1807527 [Spinellus fusiger]|nr:hypothetical protein BDF14DRAFT_1807527 [Spinellus fusiger]
MSDIRAIIMSVILLLSILPVFVIISLVLLIISLISLSSLISLISLIISSCGVMAEDRLNKRLLVLLMAVIISI